MDDKILFASNTYTRHILPPNPNSVNGAKMEYLIIIHSTFHPSFESGADIGANTVSLDPDKNQC